jgi:predicted murein hydrolase (TIGR00659 family)
VSGWQELTRNPVFGVTLTLAAYVLTMQISRRLGGKAYANPVLWSVVLIIGVLVLTGTPVEAYARGGDLIAFFLGTATVALALPLHRQLNRIRTAWLPVVAASVFGATAAVLVAGWVTRALGGGPQLVASMVPKSATTPVAIGVAETVGGIPALTAALVMLTGVLGAMAGPGLLTLLRIRDEQVRGLALGISGHGIATARALSDNPTAGAFSALAMALSAVITPVVVAVSVPLLL